MLQWAGLAEARDAHIDQPGIERAQRRGPDAQALGHAGAEVLDHHIHLLRQFMHHGHGLRMLEVQHQALLVAVHHREQRALAVPHGAYGAVVVALGRLHLDHFGAQVGQQGRGHGAGQDPCEVQDADAVQRERLGCGVCSGHVACVVRLKRWSMLRRHRINGKYSFPMH